MAHINLALTPLNQLRKLKESTRLSFDAILQDCLRKEGNQVAISSHYTPDSHTFGRPTLTVTHNRRRVLVSPLTAHALRDLACTTPVDYEEELTHLLARYKPTPMYLKKTQSIRVEQRTVAQLQALKQALYATSTSGVVLYLLHRYKTTPTPARLLLPEERLSFPTQVLWLTPATINTLKELTKVAPSTTVDGAIWWVINNLPLYL